MPQLIGNRSPTGHPTANAFQTAQGYINVLALREPQVQNFFKTVGRQDALSDPRFVDATARMANYDDTYELLAEALLCKTCEQWLVLFAASSVPAAAIRNYPELVNDEQFEHRNTFIDFPSPNETGKKARLVRAGYQTGEEWPGYDYATATPR